MASDEMAVQAAVLLGAEGCPPDVVHTPLKGSEMPRASRPQEPIQSNTPISQVGPERVSHTGGRVMARLGSSDSENKSMSIPVTNYRRERF